MKRDKKIDARVEKIVSRVSRSYMKHLNFEYIRNEIFKAYNYAYEAHN
ncbi:MAG: hypothetical protein LBU14_02855 [Candidatus Peribacteria bacterium]|jgi:hypothetical protein|nr:hypothetical protein [Candidatus Peribacteria bacterium]